jgi:uracil-DNA glycosylase family 4
MLSEAKHLFPPSAGACDPSRRRGSLDPRDVSFAILRRRVGRCFTCAAMRHVHVLSEANGPLDAAVIFVAAAPGRLGAARTGVPMTSDAAGRRFQVFLDEAGLRRERVFVTNAVLCNPLTPRGHNRRPGAREVAACRDFLVEQLRLVRAPVVVALGSVALDALRRIEPHEALLSHDVARPIAWSGRTLVPLYHPSIQSTLTRPHRQQLADWRNLGRLVRSLSNSVPPLLLGEGVRW